MHRRQFFAALALIAALPLATPMQVASAGPLRRHHRRVRRRIRRRIRRVAVTRMVFGRPFWLVPVGLAVGWELVHANRVVVVKEIKVVEREGHKVEVATVEDHSGKREDIEITREDTPENRKDLDGTRLADGDTTSPFVESEVEE
jgi:hypothetical protein